MPITTNQDADASDFINESEADATPANDAGRVPKLEDDGKLSNFFLSAAFGGDGSDGALIVSSGTTTIDLSSERVVVKNYSEISITGTGKVAFSNPHTNGTTIIFKSLGGVTLTSSQTPMIDASGIGGAGNTYTFSGASSSNGNGSSGEDGLSFGITPTTNAGGGAIYNTSGGSAGALASLAYPSTIQTLLKIKYTYVFVGAGGGTGAFGAYGSGNSFTCTGGTGGGALIIECGGAWNFTTSNGISVAGEDGFSEATGGTADGGVGGGGGGAGGYFLGLYKTLTANSGSVDASGGVGSDYDEVAGSSYNSNFCPGGGGGGNYQAGNSGGKGGAGTGGSGANGLSLIVQNTEIK